MSIRFATFTIINTTRCKRWHPGFPDADRWSIADWSTATSGEVGELADELLALIAALTASSGGLANSIKKLRRIEANHKPGAADPDVGALRAKCGEEIGDVFAYLDLTATRLGLVLEDCARDKFNAVSVREGWPDRMPS